MKIFFQRLCRNDFDAINLYIYSFERPSFQKSKIKFPLEIAWITFSNIKYGIFKVHSVNVFKIEKIKLDLGSIEVKKVQVDIAWVNLDWLNAKQIIFKVFVG